jgi:hypothetical protein
MLAFRFTHRQPAGIDRAATRFDPEPECFYVQPLKGSDGAWTAERSGQIATYFLPES